LSVPRFRIAWLMVVVAFVALDLGAIRGLFGVRDTFAELVLVGVLPMANILAAVAILGAVRRGFPPFLVGFEVFGAAAMLACLAWAWLSPDALTVYLVGILLLVVRLFRTESFGVGLVNYTIAGVLLSLPEVVLALLGGWLTSLAATSLARRRRRSVSRRADAP
jgi:hypothetical protein